MFSHRILTQQVRPEYFDLEVATYFLIYQEYSMGDVTRDGIYRFRHQRTLRAQLPPTSEDRFVALSVVSSMSSHCGGDMMVPGESCFSLSFTDSPPSGSGSRSKTPLQSGIIPQPQQSQQQTPKSNTPASSNGDGPSMSPGSAGITIVNPVSPSNFTNGQGTDGKLRPLLPNGKKTKGRVKIKMEFIDNKLRRYTTFSKRKTGIMKKAYELSTLTGTQVMLLVASETGHVYTFATKKLQPMITSEAGKALIQKCLNAPDGTDGEGSPMDSSVGHVISTIFTPGASGGGGGGGGGGVTSGSNASTGQGSGPKSKSGRQTSSSSANHRTSADSVTKVRMAA
ncbi:unnamed protein product [Soboliphyme baturini]|uniref:Serum response factor homolog n=1 Tax=Soboliphyme baturini TaxID=241478 RepID=A0A183IX51_9BILA|nr:unnamed protein product [Soboliphyme baturini]